MDSETLYKLTDYVSELDSGDVIAFYIKWHVDPPQAKRIIYEWAKAEGFCDDDELEQLEEPKHERWRKVPHPEHGMVFKQGTGRGSFPVTVMSIRDWER